MSGGRLGPNGLPRDQVPTTFDHGAAEYDRLVGFNPGYHKHLRLSAQRMQLPAGGAGLRLLDAGCGTGASTAALLSVAPDAEIVAVDASEQMLARARAKSWPSTVRFHHTRIEDLDTTGSGGRFDGIFAAYLLRNLADPDAQLRAFAALLRPGAPLALHEYSVRGSLPARLVWNIVCGAVIIPLGALLTGDTTLYRHLRRSVTAFDSVPQLRARLHVNGFTGIRAATVPGWQHGIVHTLTATVPRPGSESGRTP
ncbi:methyltransferase domain-containing protein [Nocardia speluncae]|uniref:Methyltransferase domain-containing protein n=1 Tax=Nocardia speluncae TaxID=419477 RepID=A0A846XCM7_9NOCA|nr:class I SAM-dependent methyltransferase [Nocardia speluncae]NKY32899.1 methyltransferase domain-containing protein [Nocardia speluncae]